MQDPDLQQLLNFTTELATKAGDLQMEYYEKDIEINLKAPRDLVTEVDKKCEKMIISEIQAIYPDHFILAEEGGGTSENKSGYRWIIDPVDGTTNYAHRNPFFCVSIGLEIKGEMAVGVVYAPYFKEMFKAAKGMGAFLNGKKIHVSIIKTLENSLLATGFNPRRSIKDFQHFQYFAPLSHGIRRAGAAAIDMCYVACGRLDGFWEQGLKAWDMAAGQIITTEAGGKITSLNGSDFNVDGDQVLLTNGNIHEEMAKHFKSIPDL